MISGGDFAKATIPILVIDEVRAEPAVYRRKPWSGDPQKRPQALGIGYLKVRVKNKGATYSGGDKVYFRGSIAGDQSVFLPPIPSGDFKEVSFAVGVYNDLYACQVSLDPFDNGDPNLWKPSPRRFVFGANGTFGD